MLGGSRLGVTVRLPELSNCYCLPGRGGGSPIFSGDALRFTQEQFIAKARAVHDDRYDYSLVKYADSRTKVTIICPDHEAFEQEANSHLQGIGCPDCA